MCGRSLLGSRPGTGCQPPWTSRQHYHKQSKLHTASPDITQNTHSRESTHLMQSTTHLLHHLMSHRTHTPGGCITSCHGIPSLSVCRVRKQRVGLELHGEGCLGDLLCEPARVDFGTVIIGTSSSHKLTLTNPSLCNLHYKLYTEQVHSKEKEDEGRATSFSTGTTHGMCVHSTTHTLRLFVHSL